VLKGSSMKKTLEEKLSQFSSLVSNFNNDDLIDFWNDIIDDVENEIAERELLEFQVYNLTEKNAKLQTYIAISKRPKSEFTSKYDVFSLFNRTPQYYDYLTKALNFDFRNKKPVVLKKRTKEERKKRLLNFREKIGMQNFPSIEGGLL
jgi:site-specific DNA-adenine methylase